MSTNLWTGTLGAALPGTDAVVYQQLLYALWVVSGAVVALAWMRPGAVQRRAAGVVAGLLD